jgi:DNA-directed RNA polymerase specialized sigma24 family protein
MPGRAKRRNAAGRNPRIALEEGLAITEEKSAELMALDEALTRLAERDPRQARVVELRFFGGLNEEEAAEVLGISTRTLKRDWSVARPGCTKKSIGARERSSTQISWAARRSTNFSAKLFGISIV